MLLLVLLACKGEPLDAQWCGDEQVTPQPATTPVTWWHDVAPILNEKCSACHVEGGHAPFAVDTYEAAVPYAEAIAASTLARTMPPFQAVDCCRDYFRSYALTDEEISTLVGWVEQGAPEGDSAEPGESTVALGGVSRVDLTLEMPEAYTPSPPEGAIDEQRCFVLDWPETSARYITGLAPRPRNRSVVHHLIVSAVDENGAATARARDAEDDEPGFDCSGGTGDLGFVTLLGGSLVGGDYPRGIGTKMEPDATIVLQVHYALASGTAAEPDQTAIDFMLDETATPSSSVGVTNFAWLLGPAMVIPAGESDAVYFYKFAPTLYTGGVPVDIQGVTPHMHRYAARMRVLALKPDGAQDCLLEIPRWEFGWEQPYWFEETYRFNPEDEIYIECHFDNSAANQYGGAEPRDIAWGDTDQDMCAAFLTFTTP